MHKHRRRESEIKIRLHDVLNDAAFSTHSFVFAPFVFFKDKLS